MRNHVITGAVAAIVAIAGSYGLERRVAPAPLKLVEQRTELRTVGKYGWGELSKAEQDAAVVKIGNLDRRQVQIFCDVPGCADLAEDIDEIMDRVGAASNVHKSLIDLGAGMGISPAEPQSKRVADAIREATGGRVDLKLMDVPQPGGGIVIVLGRKPRH